ncbi:thiamine pyrophosphate-dependent enzyme [Phytohabitans flavus]
MGRDGGAGVPPRPQPAARPVRGDRRGQRRLRAPRRGVVRGRLDAGELHKLWRTRDPKGYHVEYGYSCMGYEIAGGLGAKMAAPDRDVFVLVGDGSYLMMSSELVTAVQEGVKLIVVLVQNHGFASIGALSEAVGAPRFGTRYRYRHPDSGRLDGDVLPVDLAANAASLGVRVLRATTVEELRAHLRDAKAHDGTTLVHVETDPLVPAPDGGAWWDVPVAEVSTLDATRQARKSYEAAKVNQRPYLGVPDERWRYRHRRDRHRPHPPPHRAGGGCAGDRRVRCGHRPSRHGRCHGRCGEPP